MDYLIARLGTDENASQTESKYQYQRAIELSKDLTENIYVLSNKHLKQLQADSVIVYVDHTLS